jgi:hypothetical protein
MGDRRVKLTLGALMVALIASAILVPAVSEAKKHKTKAKVTVMTRNVYLGADLSPAIESTDLLSAIKGAGEIYREIERTDFASRAVPLGREIKKSKANLVGLQEVALWRDQVSDGGTEAVTGVPGAVDATEVKFDFLKDLMAEVGKKYKVVAVQEEFEGELPADVDDDTSTGAGPLAILGADRDARLTMRDVILVRKDGKVKAKKSTVKQDHYGTLFTALVGGAVPIESARGWQSVEAKYKKKGQKAVPFRFVNTHLEAFGEPTIKEAQAKELVAPGGPMNTKRRAILVGDINSGLADPHEVGDGRNSGTNGDQLAFKALLAGGLKDRGSGGEYTSGYDAILDSTAGKFDHTIDHVLTNKKAKAKLIKATVTGTDPKEMTPSGLWPSDHGGVISKLKLR